MTQQPFIPNDQPIRCVFRSERPPAPRKLPGGVMLARVLPGGALVAAALILPEFSVGADNSGRGPAAANPPEPAAKPDPARAPRLVATAAPSHPKLAGVRYAPIIDLGIDPAHAAPRIAVPSDHRATAAARRSGRAGARLAGAARTPKAADEHLDKAAAFAASVLNDFTAPPGLPGDTALMIRTSAAYPATDPLDQAAQYAASGMEAFADQAASRPAMAAVVPALASGALSASAPSAPQTVAAAAIAAAPASVAVQAVSVAVPPTPIAAAAPAASQPASGAAAAAALSPTPPARGMIEQVTPARSAAAPAPARPPAAAAAVAPKTAPALTAQPAAGAGAPRIADFDFESRLLTRVDGRSAGLVDFQQTQTGLKVRLGSVAEVLADRLPADDLARIRASSSGNAWLSLAELQAQGIPISYDPVYDEFNIGREDTRPKAARNVHIDQISTPERSAGAAVMDQIRRR